MKLLKNVITQKCCCEFSIMSTSMKEFINKFFDLCREYQEDIPPKIMADILREYAERLDG